jgi:hypothetical protein
MLRDNNVMKKSIMAGIFVALVCLGIMGCRQLKAPSTKWEYKWQYLNVPREEGKLNQLGADGWELLIFSR